MKRTQNNLLFILSLAAVLLAACGPKAHEEVLYPEKPYIIAYVHGYQDNWGPDQAKAKQITHINYAFANVVGGKVVEGKETDAESFKKLNALKKVNPALKILISVGGWGWSGGFSDAVVTSEAREVFAGSAVDFMLRHKLDGIDLDWEYPGQAGAGNTFREEDKQNFTAALQAIRGKLDSLEALGHPHYYLTIATGASQTYLDHTDMRTAQESLDFINIMTYDFKGGWNPLTGHHSNLHPSDHDSSTQKSASSTAVDQHVAAGIPVEKLVLGVPFYGRGWFGTPSQNNGLYQVSEGRAFSLPYKLIIDSLVNKNGFTRYWDESARAPYLYHADSSVFITYEDTESYAIKCDYIKENHLAGAMFWQFNQDNGDLLSTLEKGLLGE